MNISENLISQKKSPLNNNKKFINSIIKSYDIISENINIPVINEIKIESLNNNQTNNISSNIVKNNFTNNDDKKNYIISYFLNKENNTIAFRNNFDINILNFLDDKILLNMKPNNFWLADMTNDKFKRKIIQSSRRSLLGLRGLYNVIATPIEGVVRGTYNAVTETFEQIPEVIGENILSIFFVGIITITSLFNSFLNTGKQRLNNIKLINSIHNLTLYLNPIYVQYLNNLIRIIIKKVDIYKENKNKENEYIIKILYKHFLQFMNILKTNKKKFDSNSINIITSYISTMFDCNLITNILESYSRNSRIVGGKKKKILKRKN
jgi:hypothetical protein